MGSGVESLGAVAQTGRLPFDRLRANGGVLKSYDFPLVLSLSKHEIGLGNSPFILHSAYISRKFPSDPRFFSLKAKKYLHRHPSDWNISIL